MPTMRITGAFVACVSLLVFAAGCRSVAPIQTAKPGDPAGTGSLEAVRQALGHGAAACGIDLEITETLLMEDIDNTIAKLDAVRGLGVDIAIDDFGIGYSSLSYLARLPVQALKIDRSFVANLTDSSDRVSLVVTIISLAHALRMKVIAEGVETEVQADYLRLLRCDEMQGYLFGRPAPAAQTELLLQESLAV